MSVGNLLASIRFKFNLRFNHFNLKFCEFFLPFTNLHGTYVVDHYRVSLPSGKPTDRNDLMRLIEDEDAQSRSYLNQ